MQKALKVILAMTFISFFSLTCASTTTNLTWVWKDDQYQGGLLDDVMIVGITKNPIRRKMFEDAFVKQFKSNGVNAVSSAAVIPPEEALTRDQVLVEVEKLGLDAILVTHLTAMQSKEKYVPPSTSAYPHPAYARFDIYSYATGEYTKYGGSYTNRTDLHLETNIYEAESQMIIWSGKSQTIRAKYLSEVIDALCRAVLNDLRKKKLIK